ncbi:hypothetical protein TGP89_420040 [Toxoplasma gondii p89]|uniref:Uncharacterized protein n=1 Tax=Toxoplasma gondii p89 TaxID=943119 RepID=A0A086JXP8_TOXGO|nr:hypothetical protein TGP89_420040 [Toxoplasma gondii p89]
MSLCFRVVRSTFGNFAFLLRFSSLLFCRTRLTLEKKKIHRWAARKLLFFSLCALPESMWRRLCSPPVQSVFSGCFLRCLVSASPLAAGECFPPRKKEKSERGRESHTPSLNSRNARRGRGARTALKKEWKNTQNDLCFPPEILRSKREKRDEKSEKSERSTPGGTRTRNLWIRSPTRYPLRHKGW